MILGTKARYAVMAMVDLAMCCPDKPTPLKTVSERQEIPLPYLEQIFSLLRQGGLVSSVKGPGGGYTLARERAEISIAMIVAAVNEETKMTRCNATALGCMPGQARCHTHALWEGLEGQINQYLNRITLEHVCTRNMPACSTDAGQAIMSQISA